MIRVLSADDHTSSRRCALLTAAIRHIVEEKMERLAVPVPFDKNMAKKGRRKSPRPPQCFPT